MMHQRAGFTETLSSHQHFIASSATSSAVSFFLLLVAVCTSKSLFFFTAVLPPLKCFTDLAGDGENMMQRADHIMMIRFMMRGFV